MSWAIGKDPDKSSMMVSYSASIARDKFFNGVSTIIEDENGNFQKIFPNLEQIYRNAETLSLDYADDGRKKPHSEYTLYCAGFDGGITGRTRAHNILYLDDLVKNMEAANNKDVMDKMTDEFNATLRKRMQGNCKMLIIGTLFSINDPFTRTVAYFKENAPDRIEVIRIPGLNADNETNFPYKYGMALTTEQLLEDKALMDTVSFECLIQQNPIERLGILFSEEELVKFEEEPIEGFQRRIAAVDVAWGGGDSLSMPIGSEYNNGDVYLTDVVFSKGPKEETIPLVVNAIIKYQISCCFFEANNGGDMYAEKVQEELKKQGYKCNIMWGKVPTTKSKLDRILACTGAIKGSPSSEYRLLIKSRKFIKNNKMYNDFIDEMVKFNQTPAMQNKQHDDACFDGKTLIATQFGYKKIKDIKVGDKVITPFGLKKVIASGVTGYKETINKFGLKVTPNHKAFNKIKNKFIPIDTFTSLEECDIMSLKGMILWRKKLLNLMVKNTREVLMEDITLKRTQNIKKEHIARNYIEQSGNITMEKSQKDIKFIIKMAISIIMTLVIWNVFQLGNIFRIIVKKDGKIKNIENEWQTKCEEIQQSENIVQLNVEKNIKKKIPVYNITVEDAGCYYANGILVSNCDSLASLFTNVLGVQRKGIARSRRSRADLGI